MCEMFGCFVYLICIFARQSFFMCIIAIERRKYAGRNFFRFDFCPPLIAPNFIVSELIINDNSHIILLNLLR